MVESQFANVKPPRKRRKSRRMRKNYDVVVLAPRKAKGRYPKGQGLNKRTRIKGRKPIMGDRMVHSDDVFWLRAGGG